MDAAGKRRCVGTPLLKSTQSYPALFGDRAAKFALLCLESDSHPTPALTVEAELDEFLRLPIDDHFEDVKVSVVLLEWLLV